jgi:hypothetical protein
MNYTNILLPINIEIYKEKNMKQTLLALLIVAPLSVALTGCVIAVDGDHDGHSSSNFDDREFENRKKISAIALNSQYSMVVSQLGVADFTEAYQANDKEVKVVYYRTQRVHKDGLTTKDECTYLHFENGILIDTGEGNRYVRKSVN